MDFSKFIGPYVLDWKNLQLCDIVLSRESLSIDGMLQPKRMWDVAKSGAIRLGSKHYSHAMLYVGGSIIHAHPPMVFAVNPQRLSAAPVDDYTCLRFDGLTLEQKRKIEEFARSQVGALYSIPEAVKTVVNKSGDTKDLSGVEFCSRLVAEAYSYAGIQLVPNCSYCAPGDFLSVESLMQIGACTRCADEHDKAILKSTDFVLLSQERAYDWLKRVRVMSENDGFDVKTINSIFEYVQSFPSRDSEVFDALKESRYLETWKDDKAAHGYRYNPMAMQIICQNQPDDFFNEVICLFDCTGRYGDELIKLNQIKGGSKTFGAIADLYSDMLKDIQKRVGWVVSMCISQPGVGPLSTLYAICEHLVKGSYSRYYSLPVCKEVAKLRNEWERQIGMSV